MDLGNSQIGFLKKNLVRNNNHIPRENSVIKQFIEVSSAKNVKFRNMQDSSSKQLQRMAHTWWSFVTYAPNSSMDVMRKLPQAGTLPGLPFYYVLSVCELLEDSHFV